MKHLDPKIVARRRMRRLLTRIALILVIVVAIAFAATALVRQLGKASAAPPSTPTTTTTMPADEVVLAGTRLPISPVAGPHRVGNGLAKGFTHDAPGAAYAALHLSLRVTPEVGPGVFDPTFASQVVNGTALRTVVEDEYRRLQQATGTPHGGPVGEVLADARGYRVDAVDTRSAAVRLLLHSRDTAGAGLLTTFAIQLRWVEGDWMLLAPSDGDWTPMVARVWDSSGFSPFRRV